MVKQERTLLILASALFAVSGGLATLFGNLYWLQAPVAPDYEAYRPEGLWENVFSNLLTGVAAEALFLLIFLWPVLKLKRAGLIAFLSVNFLAASYASFIYLTLTNPLHYAGWASLGFVMLGWAPMVLGLWLSILAIVRRKSIDKQVSAT